ncbi:MAG: ABC transporter ATP-binding protein [Deltaproteobacteria bacterium]|nr:ABC transporter ATP-binding protein [Deltaproteobacteria bacterium]
MAYIELSHAQVDFNIYNNAGRSLKRAFLNAATGGKIARSEQGYVTVRALDDISFTLEDGAKLGLIGHNGCGKSTLLRVLSGVYAPTGGSATIQGTTGSLIDINLGIDPEATGRENIYIRAGLLDVSKKDIDAYFDDIVQFCDLGQFIDLPLRTYSTGMQMRLAFAVSTLIRPDILLMDEWLSVGDETFKAKAEQRMSDIVSDVSILVIASHSRELIANVCNKVIWLEHGRIKAMGSPDEILPMYFG